MVFVAKNSLSPALLGGFVGVVVVPVATIAVVRGFLLYGVKDNTLHFYAVLPKAPFGQFQLFGRVGAEASDEHGGAGVFADDGWVGYGQDGRVPNTSRIFFTLVSLRIVLLPAPVIRADFPKPPARLPVKQCFGVGGIGVALGNVAGTAFGNAIRDRFAAGRAERLDHIQHAVANAGAQVAGDQVVLIQRAECGQVALGQIHHVDIVAHAGAIAGGVVVAVDAQFFQLAHCHLGNERHQVVGDAVRVLTDLAAFVGAGGIEVAQDGDAPVRLGTVQVAQHVFDVQLARAVGVGGAEREVFANRHAGRVAVDGGRRAEHDAGDVGALHGLQQAQAAEDVVVVVVERFSNRFADGFEAGEVDHGVNGVGVEQLV